jgi:hypothetical protein
VHVRHILLEIDRRLDEANAANLALERHLTVAAQAGIDVQGGCLAWSVRVHVVSSLLFFFIGGNSLLQSSPKSEVSTVFEQASSSPP